AGRGTLRRRLRRARRAGGGAVDPDARGADDPGEAGRAAGLDVSTRSLRVGVVGAARRRNGTGPFLARMLDGAGAKVVAVEGTTVVPDSMPHVSSLLDHLYPAHDRRLETIRVEAASPRAATVRFVHPGGREGVACTVRLETCETPPRPLSFGFDGRVAERVV